MGRIPFLLGMLVVVSVLLVASGAMIASAAHSPAPWREELHKYLTYREQVFEDRLVVVASVRAAKPWRFERGMSSLLLGDSLIYQTDVHYDEVARETQPPSLAGPGNVVSYTSLTAEAGYQSASRSAAPGDGGRMPLPFPPVKVWCVLLNRPVGTDRSEARQSLVFVSQHRDIYMADWIVHQGEDAPFSPDFVEHVSRIGCASLVQDMRTPAR
jgi:hypothetical protein